MSGGGTNPLMKYVLPALETVGGGVSEFFAPGNPIGIGLMGSGVGQLAGGAAGGNSGQAMGGALGGLAGLGGGLFGGSSLAGLFGGGAANQDAPMAAALTNTGDIPSMSAAEAQANPGSAADMGKLGQLGMAGLQTLGPIAGAMGGGSASPAPPPPLQTGKVQQQPQQTAAAPPQDSAPNPMMEYAQFMSSLRGVA